ncbi:MAG: cytochrome c biogenesis protein CcdA [Actinobacteria bacterium]|nr:cytochrome c biogenesis protein CcdA [Actinomycetota bacterium]
MADVGIITAFVFGIVSFLSPCVLPLLPGYLSLMSGYSVGDLQSGDASSTRMFRVTLTFVIGFTIIFVILGAAATSVGHFFLQHQRIALQVAGWIVIAFGLLIVVSAYSSSRYLGFLTRERRIDVKPSKLGGWAPLVMGLAFGFAWTPCIGPVLAAILAAAAVQETVGQGMILLLAYGLGLGVPFILSGVGLSKAFRAVGFLKRYLRPINVVSGLLLAGFGVLMITGKMAILSGWVQEIFSKLGLEWLATI